MSETRQKSSAGDSLGTNFRQVKAKQEVMDLHKEYAAIKIQAGARGFLCRRRIRQMRDAETIVNN